MPEEYLREQLWKLYEKLPEELKDALFSVETADNIDNICQRNAIEEEKIPEIAKYTGRVLMGLLLPNEFEKTLIKEVKLKAEVAKNVAREINRFIFFPLKEVLSKLYEVEIAPPVRPPSIVHEVRPEVTAEEERLKKPDIYREPIE